METNKPTCLVLSGGHIKGIYMLGALHYLHINGYLNNLSIFCGTSVGSIIDYLLILGYTPINILVYLSTNKIAHETMSLFNLIKNFGLYNYEIIDEHMKKLTFNKLTFIPTLQQLYDRTQKKLICITYNQTTKKTLYISHETHPNLSVLMALRMSANMPLVFEQLYYNGEKYCDGGISDNFGVKNMDETLDKKEIILGIEIDNDCKVESVNKKEENNGFINNIFSILNTPLIELYKLRNLKCSDRVKIVSLQSSDNTFFNFELNVKYNMSLFSSGFSQMKVIYEGDKKDDEVYTFEDELKKYKKE